MRPNRQRKTTLVCLESSKSTKVTTVKVVRNWLILVMVTTATTTSSSASLATMQVSQDKAVNSIAITSMKVRRLVSVHVTRLIATSTLLFAGIDSNNKTPHKIKINAGNSTKVHKPTPNITKIQTIDSKVDQINPLNTNQQPFQKSKQMLRNKRGLPASGLWRHPSLV
jgi:hypothetical protein